MALALLGLMTLNPMTALSAEGFTAPYRTIHIAAPEAGILTELLVQEGDVVERDQPLVRLDVDIHEALLAIARVGKEAHGQLEAADAEVALRQQRLEALESLRGSGHARQEEVDRARADLAIASGNLKAAREQQQLRQLEYEKIEVQIERRTVRAPQAGVVTELFKQVGEFTAPNDPNLLVLVQLDPLVATFDIVPDAARRIEVGDEVSVWFKQSGTTADAMVEYLSPVIDAESGTIAVKLRIPNHDLRLQSGQACMFEVR